MVQSPKPMIQEDVITAVDHVIRERKTAKVLRDRHDCAPLPEDLQTNLHTTLQALIELAGWAPFHKLADKQLHRQGTMQSIVPWRFHVLEKPACCQLVNELQVQAEQFPDSIWSRAWDSKIPQLLAGSSALILATWLPDPSSVEGMPELTINNMEHIAAASAAVQNLLLASEARGLHTYWGSGGILRSKEIFEYLQISTHEILLGAIFITSPEVDARETQPGSLRNQRGTPADWSRWVELE